MLPVGGTFAELFYGRLFALEPAVRRLFRDDPVEQGRNLTAMLSVSVASLGRPERITRALRQLGERHVGYGVEPRHFALVEDALVFALQHVLIDIFGKDAEAAWRAAYAFLTQSMLAAATPTGFPATDRAGARRGPR